MLKNKNARSVDLKHKKKTRRRSSLRLNEKQENVQKRLPPLQRYGPRACTNHSLSRKRKQTCLLRFNLLNETCEKQHIRGVVSRRGAAAERQRQNESDGNLQK